MVHPTEYKKSPAIERLELKMHAGQHYEMLADLREVNKELEQLRFRTPTPEGWVQTFGGIPRPECENGKEIICQVYNKAWGKAFAVYASAEWEDKKLWEPYWSGDFETIIPRTGWCARDKAGQMFYLEPQPTHYMPPPAAPSE